MRYAGRFAVTLSTKFLLDKFFFDSQDLEVVISPFASGAVRIDVKANREMTRLVPGRFLELEQWKLSGIMGVEQTTSIGDTFNSSKSIFVCSHIAALHFMFGQSCCP